MDARREEGRKEGNIKQESSVHYFHRPEDGRTDDDLISASLVPRLARSIVWFQFGRREWTWTMDDGPEAAFVDINIEKYVLIL